MHRTCRRVIGKHMKYLTFTRAALLGVSLATAAGCSFNFSTNKGANADAANVSTAGTNTNAGAPAGDPVAAGGESQSATASALVADLYKQHDAKRSPFFQTKDRARVDKYFIKPLADLIWKDANDSSGEVGVLDGDPLYNAQDIQIKNFKVGEAEVKGETAKVPVTFNNYDQKVSITFSLRQVSGAWKIDDIRYSESDSLMKWLRSGLSDTSTASPAGEFEGKYQVGDTTCTVTPFKMAFEVKWAKGSGVETFFFKEGNTFESDEKGGRPNRFEFDDENYNTGTFYRADGKTFAVKRAR